MITISVIVPIYGVEKYIEKCAISLLEQDCEDVEYIFVDDSTKDNSITILNEVVKRYPNVGHRLKIIHHEFNKGLSSARNTGLDASSGQYIMHVDSDDYLEMGALSLLLEKIKSTDADILCFGAKLVYDDFIKTTGTIKIDSIEDYRKQVIAGNANHAIWGKVIKKDLYKKYGIRAVDGLHQGEDYAVYCRLLYYAKSIAYVDVPLYNYLVRTNIYLFKEKIVEDTYNAWEVVDTFYKQKPDGANYIESLNEGYLMYYSWLIFSWQDCDYTNKEGATVISQYFQREIESKSLPFRKKAIIYLFEHKHYHLLHSFVSLSKKIQLLLKRRGSNVN